MLYSQYFLLLRCLHLLGGFLKTYMCNIRRCYVYICIAIFLRKLRNYLFVAGELQNKLGLDFAKIRDYWLDVIFRSSLVQPPAERIIL